MDQPPNTSKVARYGLFCCAPTQGLGVLTNQIAWGVSESPPVLQMPLGMVLRWIFSTYPSFEKKILVAFFSYIGLHLELAIWTHNPQFLVRIKG